MTYSEIEKAFSDYHDHFLYDYQKRWLKIDTQPERMFIGFRQSGLGWVFAFEALKEAKLYDNRTMVFAPTADQAKVIKAYILAISTRMGIEPDITMFVFLGEKSKVPDDFEGHIYCSDFMYMNNIEQTLAKINMIKDSGYITTYFSAGNRYNFAAKHFYHDFEGPKVITPIEIINVDGSDYIMDVRKIEERNSKEVFDTLYRCVF